MRPLGDLAKVCALLVIFGGSGAAISACNTVEGAGQDVKAAGQGISRTAREVKQDM